MKTWSGSDIAKLLDAVAKYDVLWNSTLPLYRNPMAKQKAWSHVREEMDGFDHKQIKVKYHHLNRKYKDELKEKIAKESMGQVHVPKSQWFKKMYSFLGKVSGVPHQVMDVSEDDIEYINDVEEVYIDDNEPVVKKLKPSDMVQPEVQILRKMLVAPPVSSDKGKCETGAGDSDESLDKACEAFGQSVSVQLKEFSFLRSMEVQMKIQTLLTEELIKDRRSKPQYKKC